MKILIIVESLKVGGGSERFAATLGSALFHEGYGVSYLTLMDKGPKFNFKGDYHTLNIPDIYVNSLKRVFDLLSYSPKISHICNHLNIDLIISVSEVGNLYAVLSRWLFRNDVHIIASQHINPRIFVDDRIKSLSLKLFYPKADETICVSKDIERILNNDYGIHNTETIYNMMNIQDNIQLSKEELPDNFKTMFKGDHFNFINIGRLTNQKGQWFLIRSFRRVVDEYPDAKLFILGEGPLRRDLEDLISKLRLDKNVFLIGDQENVFPFLKNSDCFVFTSLWEGLPLVLIEALSMSIPVISTDCKTGPKEILCPELDLEEEPNYPYFGKYAILNQPFPKEYFFDTVEERPLSSLEENLAYLMIKMMKDPDLKKKYSNGQVRAEEFDEHQIINQWNELLKKYE